MDELIQCKKRIERLDKAMDKVIRENQGWFPDDSTQIEDCLYRAERLTLSMRKLFNSNYSPSKETTEKRFKKITQDVFNVDVKIESIDEIHIKIPAICSKKKTNGQYVRETLNELLAPYFPKPLMLKDRVVVFKYTYSPLENGGIRDIDYDNVEYRSILNVLTKYVIYDDAPRYYELHSQFEEGDERSTTISILSHKKYIELIQAHMKKEGD